MVVIDPAHGGTDLGHVGNDIVEKEMVLEISKIIYDRLKQLGVPVTLTRVGDETLSPDERVNKILNSYGNNPNVIVISNELNAGDGTEKGAEVIYALRGSSTLPNLIVSELSSSGQITNFPYQLRSPSNTAEDYYFIHRDTGVTQAILIRYGYVDNPNDAYRLKTNYEDYAEAVVRAITRYLGVPYIPPEGANIHVVARGDTLYSLANKYGVSISSLRSANNLTSDVLSIGQILIIPDKETTPKPEEPSGTTYIVKSGDSLYSIANKFGTTVDEIKKLNNLTSNLLSIDQVLKIPGKEEAPVSGITYTVKSGDSLYSIANRYGTTVDEIKRLNKLTSNLLSIGQVLKIPSGETIPKPEEQSGTTYTVKSGDNLYAIATKYGTTVDEIKRLNNLTSNLLSIGQVLKIPAKNGGSSGVITYIVKSGDSLYSIANRYGTTVDEIKRKNNLTSNLLSIGQVLII